MQNNILLPLQAASSEYLVFDDIQREHALEGTIAFAVVFINVS